MLHLGKTQTLTISHIDQRGAWLAAGTELVLLPKNELPADARPGTELTLFVFGEVAGQALATLRTPRAEVGEFALFPVSQVNPHGVFLDWGIGKELLVPRSKQPKQLGSGDSCLARVELDREGRPFANGRIEQILEPAGPELGPGRKVKFMLWAFTDLGAKVIVEHRYSGLLYRDELLPGMVPGAVLDGFVKTLRADGKLDVTLRRGGRAELEAARKTLLAALAGCDLLPLHDDSPPEAIRARLGMSKKLFKKTLGGLYKAGLVELVEGGIRRKGRGSAGAGVAPGTPGKE